MADVSIINGYNINDAVARAGLADKLDKSGGTLTGALNFTSGVVVRHNGEEVFAASGTPNKANSAVDVGSAKYNLTLYGLDNSLSYISPSGTHKIAYAADLDNYQPKPTVKSTVGAILTVNTEYYLGAQTSLTLTLPSTADNGTMITVDFESGGTATALSISGNVAGDLSFAPEANKLIEISFKRSGNYWKMLVSSLDVPTEVA